MFQITVASNSGGFQRPMEPKKACRQPDEIHGGKSNSVAFSPDGIRLANGQ